MRLIPTSYAFLVAIALCWGANADDAKKNAKDSDVAEKLARMKPSFGEQPKTAPVLLYTVEGAMLDGKAASVCDINNCRIAIVGVDISNTRGRDTSLNLRVAGEGLEEQAVKGADGKAFFFSKYEGGKALCRFHGFEFDINERVLGYGELKDLGYRAKATLWANPTNAGVLILVDSSTGKFTSHAMRPKSKRAVLQESNESHDRK